MSSLVTHGIQAHGGQNLELEAKTNVLALSIHGATVW